MAATDTKGDLLRYLDHATRELSPDNASAFTTAQIADECHISRNLASQYLNELVRDGMAVKVGARPRLFFHRSGLERYLQKPLKKSEYASIEDLLEAVGSLQKHDFEKLIGCDMSLGVCIEQLKSAISYPPHGLPVLLVGDHGTGKETLARLSYEYGLICPEPRQAARHPMSARPEPPGPAGRSLPLPNAPGSASCPHETMRASCSFSYPRIPRCRGPHIGVPAWRQDSTLTPCVTGMPAAHRPFASAAGVSRNQGALPGAFQISQAPAGPPSIPCL